MNGNIETPYFSTLSRAIPIARTQRGTRDARNMLGL
jgi:hypothetical protein